MEEVKGKDTLLAAIGKNYDGETHKDAVAATNTRGKATRGGQTISRKMNNLGGKGEA